MGFLAAYSKTARVPLGNPEHGYWVEVKECLSNGDKEEAEAALTSGDLIPGQDLRMRMDISRYRQLMVLASVTGWNLDDEHGEVWPVDLEHVRMIPGALFDQLWQVVDGANAPASQEENQRFPAEGVSGDTNGRRRAAKSK